MPTTVTKSKKSDSVGRVMTQEEYDEWKESKNKPVKDEEDGGISWGFGMFYCTDWNTSSDSLDLNVPVC